MQQAGERGHAVELLMAHDAQVIDIAFHLAELGAEGVYLIAIAEGDHPALQRSSSMMRTRLAITVRSLNRQISSCVSLPASFAVRRRGRGDHLADQLSAQLSGGLAQAQQLRAAWLITSIRRWSSMAITPS
jgi:hypothetical protein